jgi:DUF2075 family protein
MQWGNYIFTCYFDNRCFLVLFLDYIGVIIGDDMRYKNDHIITDYSKRAKTDQSLKGINKIAKK